MKLIFTLIFTAYSIAAIPISVTTLSQLCK